MQFCLLWLKYICQIDSVDRKTFIYTEKQSLSFALAMLTKSRIHNLQILFGVMSYKWKVIEHFLPFICIFYGFSIDSVDVVLKTLSCFNLWHLLLFFYFCFVPFLLCSGIYSTGKTFLIIFLFFFCFFCLFVHCCD